MAVFQKNYLSRVGFPIYPPGYLDNTKVTLYKDLYPIATTTNPYGGWSIYENKKHDYRISYPSELLIKHELSVQSDWQELDIYQWNKIGIERYGDDWSVRVSIEAWLPESVFNWTNKRVDATDIKIFAQEMREAVSRMNTPGVDMPSEVREVELANKKAYEYSWHGETTIFIENNKTKFIIMFANDLISKTIAYSLNFIE